MQLVVMIIASMMRKIGEIKTPNVLLNLGAFHFLFHIDILCLMYDFNVPPYWFLLGKINMNLQWSLEALPSALGWSSVLCIWPKFLLLTTWVAFSSLGNHPKAKAVISITCHLHRMRSEAGCSKSYTSWASKCGWQPVWAGCVDCHHNTAYFFPCSASWNFVQWGNNLPTYHGCRSLTGGASVHLKWNLVPVLNFSSRADSQWGCLD